MDPANMFSCIGASDWFRRLQARTRRVQELRKELGYQPTDVLEAVYVFGLGDEDAELLQPHRQKMQELVRTKTVYFGGTDEKLTWHPFQLDEKKLSLAMVK